MKSEELIYAFGMIDDDIITDTQKIRVIAIKIKNNSKRYRRRIASVMVALASCVCLVATGKVEMAYRFGLDYQSGGNVSYLGDQRLNKGADISIANTMTYESHWVDRISQLGGKRVFYSNDGEKMCNYLSTESEDTYVLDNNMYTAVRFELSDGRDMYLIMPKDSTCDEMLQKEKISNIVSNGFDRYNCEVRFPSFDV